MIFYEEPEKVKCYLEDDIEAIKLEWFNLFVPANAENNHVKNALRKSLIVINEKGNKIHNWIIDMSNAKGSINILDLNWINEEFFPEAVNAGLEKMVIIVSKSAISNMSNNIWKKNKKDLGIIIEDVQNITEAKDFLINGK